MPALSVEPRPLDASERAVLEHILSSDLAGAPELRRQLDRTEVVAIWGRGSLSVDLRVRDPYPRAALSSPLVPVDAQVHDSDGSHIGELLVWTDGGATLAALEFAWVTDAMPTSLPAVEQIRLTRRA